MKWSNKEKQDRREDWCAVSAPQREEMQQAKEWCNQQESAGKYYYHYSNTRWWFEKESDAIWFVLRFNTK